MDKKRSDLFNGSGYPDPTAYACILKENDLEKKCSLLIKVVKTVIELSGFEVVGRIVIRDKKSGRLFK